MTSDQHSTRATVVDTGWRMMALLDTAAHITPTTEHFCCRGQRNRSVAEFQHGQIWRACKLQIVQRQRGPKAQQSLLDQIHPERIGLQRERWPQPFQAASPSNMDAACIDTCKAL